MTSLARLRLDGRGEAIGANDPIELGSDRGWLIAAGALTLFAQGVTDRGPGRRRLLGTLGEGDLLWMGPSFRAPNGWRLIAVGRPGTRVHRLAASELLRSSDHQELAGAMDAVSAAIDTGASDEAGAAHQDGTASREGAAEDVVALAAARLHAVVAAALAADRADDARRARAIAARPSGDRRRLERELTGLADVFDPHADGSAAEDVQTQVALVIARIGRAIGLSLPVGPVESDHPRRMVRDAMRDSGGRLRVISLAERWWTRPGVPFVGYASGGTRPVALLPARDGWVMYDPAADTDVPVDAELASRLAATGHAVYAPLPDGPIGPWRLLRFGFHGSGRSLGTLLALGLVAGVLGLITPLTVGIVYDFVLPTGHLRLLGFTVVLLALAAVGTALVVLSRNLALVRLEGEAQARIDPAIIDRLMRIDGAALRGQSAGDLASRIVGLQRMRNQISGPVATSFLTLVFSIASLVLVFAYSWVLGLVAVVTLAILLATLVAISAGLLSHETTRLNAAGRLSALLFEGVEGIPKVRVAGAELRFLSRWASGFRTQQRAEYQAGRLSNMSAALTTAMSGIVLVPIYAVSATVLRDDLSQGRFLATVTALGQFTGAVAALSLSVTSILLTVPLWRRLQPVLSAPSEPVGERRPGRISGSVEVADVDFRYGPDEPLVLEGVSLRAEPGELIAITGPSGSGKSTLLRLLLGLERPEKGAVLIEGLDAGLLDMAELRRQIGVVTQDAAPLPGAIIETILGASDGSESDAWYAAEAAGLADDIRSMPMGMRTIVGEGASAFSGGQVQRFMIARALARRPSLLLFDEATSALDDETQRVVSDNLASLRTTRIVVAHRLSTIREADRIYVLDGGRVVERGSFDQLMRADGTFARLARRQMTAPDAATGPGPELR